MKSRSHVLVKILVGIGMVTSCLGWFRKPIESSGIQVRGVSDSYVEVPGFTGYVVRFRVINTHASAKRVRPRAGLVSETAGELSKEKVVDLRAKENRKVEVEFMYIEDDMSVGYWRKRAAYRKPFVEILTVE